MAGNGSGTACGDASLVHTGAVDVIFGVGLKVLTNEALMRRFCERSRAHLRKLALSTDDKPTGHNDMARLVGRSRVKSSNA